MEIKRRESGSSLESEKKETRQRNLCKENDDLTQAHCHTRVLVVGIFDTNSNNISKAMWAR